MPVVAAAVSRVRAAACAVIVSAVRLVVVVSCSGAEGADVGATASDDVVVDVDAAEVELVGVVEDGCAVDVRSGARPEEGVVSEGDFDAGSRVVLGGLGTAVVVEREAVSVLGAGVRALTGSERVAVAAVSLAVSTVELTALSFRGADGWLGSLPCCEADAAGVESGALEAVESAAGVERAVLSVDGAELGLDALVSRGLAAGALALVSPVEEDGALC